MITQGTGGVGGASSPSSSSSAASTTTKSSTPINTPKTSPEVTSSTKAKTTPAASSKTSGDTAKVIAKITREQFVRVMSKNAVSIEASATILPTLQLDPRDNMGKEVVRLSNGTKFSGDYLLTEVTTEYASGKRTRTLSGVGIGVDGLNVVPTPSSGVSKVTGKAKANVATEKTTTSSDKTTTTTKTAEKAPAQKPNVPASQMQLGKDGVWREVK